MPITKHRTAAIAAAVGLSLGGGAYASAASQPGSSTTPANPNEQALTGDTAAKVKAAALAKLPGATVLRVETDEGGVYEAHVRTSAGAEAEVHVDKDFNVTSVDTRPAGGGRGGHGGGHLDTAALAKSLGVTEAKLQAALDTVRPAQGDHDAQRTEEVAAIAKALGASTADVQAVLDANRPDRSAGGPGQRPDRSALAKALADKLGVTQAQAQAALDAAHGDKGDRADAMATALAKELGVDAAKVKSALEAQRPQRP